MSKSHFHSQTLALWQMTPEFGLEIRGCQEPRAPLNSPAAPCQRLLYWFTFKWLLNMQLGPWKKSKFQALQVYFVRFYLFVEFKENISKVSFLNDKLCMLNDVKQQTLLCHVNIGLA